MNAFGTGRANAICPRCKKLTLNFLDCGESGLYKSKHLLCVPCFHDEEVEIDAAGTNDLPETLKKYGSPNDIYADDPW